MKQHEPLKKDQFLHTVLIPIANGEKSSEITKIHKLGNEMPVKTNLGAIKNQLTKANQNHPSKETILKSHPQKT